MNVGLMVSFRRLFALSIIGQLLVLGFVIFEDLEAAPVFVPFLLLAFLLHFACGVLLLQAGRGGEPVPWPMLRWLFTAGAAVLTLRIATSALPLLADGELFTFLLLAVMFLVPTVGQVVLMWWVERQGQRTGAGVV